MMVLHCYGIKRLMLQLDTILTVIFLTMESVGIFQGYMDVLNSKRKNTRVNCYGD